MTTLRRIELARDETGRQAVKAICEALAARGASAISVLTNSTKEVVDERRDLYRATPPPA